LADFHIRRAAFEVARDVYEEGMCAVATVRDFTLIFDALSHFEESFLAAKLAGNAAWTIAQWTRACMVQWLINQATFVGPRQRPFCRSGFCFGVLQLLLF
jgi:hypothetical protein